MKASPTNKQLSDAFGPFCKGLWLYQNNIFETRFVSDVRLTIPVQLSKSYSYPMLPDWDIF